jgi:hypothetical protein
MNINLRLFSMLMLLMFLSGTMLFGAINGENKFIMVGEVPTSQVDLGLYDIVSLPDLNNNGLEELLVCADRDPEGTGTDFYILERNANNELVKVWEYSYTNSYYSYGVEYGDVDGDGWIEIIGLCSASAGQKGVVFFEVDSTITDGYPLPAVPTYEFDLSGTGAAHDPYQAAVGNIDTDTNNELIICDIGLDKVFVLEDLNGDISNPNWNFEFTDDFDARSVVIGDLDNDGFKDFAVSGQPDCKLVIYENTGADDAYEVRFNKDLFPGAGAASAWRSLAYYDFNGDFIQEIIYPIYHSTGKVYIIDNPGELAGMTDANVHELAALGGRLTGCTTGNQEFTPSAATYDGRDIYITTRDGGILYDIEYIGGTGVFDAVDPNNYQTYTIYENSNAGLRGVATHSLGKSPDFDGDGRGDLVVIGTGSNSYMRLLEHEPANQLGMNIIYQDPSTEADPNDPVNSNPRNAVGNVDIDQDGKQEIFITEYTGQVHCYEATGNDNEFEWVWSDSSSKPIAGGGSTPRSLAVSDIDGNGRWELILNSAGQSDLHPDSAGVWFFEWDGVNDNGIGLSQGVPFTGGPTFILPQNLMDPRIVGGYYVSENMHAADIDGDGKMEYILANNGPGSASDGLIVLHCVDGTLDSGFPTFKADVWMRSDLALGGSPFGSGHGDTDGDGNMEAIFMIWDNLQFGFAEYLSEDSVEFFLSPKFDTLGGDAVFYNSLATGDLDGDGDDEIIGVTYSGPPRVFIINPPAGDLTKVDPYNPNHMTIVYVNGQFGGELGDPNNDGKWDLMIAEYRRSKVSALTLEGTDPMDANSWITSEVFYDDSWVPIPTPADYDSTAPSPDPSMNLYEFMLYHWNDGVHSLTDGSFAIKQLNDYDNDGEKEIWMDVIQSPFSDSWFLIAEATDVGIEVSKWKIIMPADYKLEDAYPNPFNANCTIKYSLPLDKNVNIKIYNMLGQVVKTLVDNKFQLKGEYKVTWDGTNDHGMLVASGTYIYSLEVGKHIKHTKRLSLVK